MTRHRVWQTVAGSVATRVAPGMPHTARNSLRNGRGQRAGGQVQEPGQRGERPPQLQPTVTSASCAPAADRRPGSLSPLPRHVTDLSTSESRDAIVTTLRCSPLDDTTRSTKETAESVTMSAKSSIIPTEPERAFVRARARQAARAIFEAERACLITLVPMRDSCE